MKRRALLPVLLGTLLASAIAVPVQAAPEPSFIVTWVCAELNGGEWRVAKKSDVTMAYAWTTKSRRQSVKFLKRSTVELTVDGVAVSNADLLWSIPEQIPTGDWVVRWTYKLGRLGPANSVDVNFRMTFSQDHWDGYDLYPAGEAENSDCRVYTRGA